MGAETITEDERRFRRAARKVTEIAGVAIISLVIYFLMPLDGDFADLIAAALFIAAAIALIPLSVRRARQVLTSDQPLLVAAQALCSIITLLIVSFSSVYYVLAKDHTGQINGLHTKIDGIYFTVTIVSTVGFGDITATGQVARAIVTGHMIINFVLVAIAIRLMSWALKQRKDVAQSEARF